jgi:alpha-N-arabinofuranosidase
LQFNPKTENEKAGLIIFQSEHNYYYLCQSIKKGKAAIQLFKATPGADMELMEQQVRPSASKNVQLKIEARAQRTRSLIQPIINIGSL